jgi:arginine N-succinyltransferase
MVIIRPVASADLDPLVELTHFTGHGLTTLPKDPDFLRKRIDKSRRSFAGMGDVPGNESYLFVMEELDHRRVIGACGIIAKVGGYEPFYAYRIETSVHESTFLGVRKEIKTLHLVAEHNGPCEVCSLFLSPDFRHGGNGRILSLSRFLFMAEHPHAFDPTVIAEMRGVVDDQGRSHFWDALGKHFFDVDFPKADYLSLVNKKFIADLMPKHPIYIPLLPPDAQAVIGQVHEQTRPALRLLESEGFRFRGEVDIFEGGPIITCPLNQVRTIRESRRDVVAEIATGEMAGEDSLLASVGPEFRAGRGLVETVADGGVRVGRDVAEALRLRAGDVVRYSPFRSGATRGGAEQAQTPVSTLLCGEGQVEALPVAGLHPIPLIPADRITPAIGSPAGADGKERRT